MAKRVTRRDWFKGTAAGVGMAGVAGSAQGREAADALQVAQKLDRVPTKELGTTGKQIPILLMGGSQKFDPKYDKRLHRSFKDGVTYIDTSSFYVGGQAHKVLAPFVEQVGRDNLWITSKAWLKNKTVEPEEYVVALEEMLPDLKTDHLDMYFMHSVDQMRQLDPGFIKMGEEVKKRGLTKHFGFSCHMGNVVSLMNKAAEIGAPSIDCIQFRYNFSKYGDLELNKAMDACRNAGIGLIAMKTQASVPEDSDMVKKFQSDEFTLHQAKLKAVWADDRIDACTSEMTNIEQVQQNTDAAKSLADLSVAEFHQLNRYAAQTAHLRCQGCNQHCESHVAGDLRIADTLRYLMYAESYDKVERARELYQELSASERVFDPSELEIASLRCPQGIDIAQRLERAREVLA